MPLNCYPLHGQYPQPLVENCLSLGFHNTQFPFLSALLTLPHVVTNSETPPMHPYSRNWLLSPVYWGAPTVTARYLVRDISDQQRMKAEWIWEKRSECFKSWQFHLAIYALKYQGSFWIKDLRSGNACFKITSSINQGYPLYRKGLRHQLGGLC